MIIIIFLPFELPQNFLSNQIWENAQEIRMNSSKKWIDAFAQRDYSKKEIYCVVWNGMSYNKENEAHSKMDAEHDRKKMNFTTTCRGAIFDISLDSCLVFENANEFENEFAAT